MTDRADAFIAASQPKLRDQKVQKDWMRSFESRVLYTLFLRSLVQMASR